MCILQQTDYLYLCFNRHLSTKMYVTLKINHEIFINRNEKGESYEK